MFNFWSHFSVRTTKLKLDTHMGKGLIYCVHQIQAARIYLFLYFFLFFLSLQLAKCKNLLLQNCFNLPQMATAGGMWALLALCYIWFCHAAAQIIYWPIWHQKLNNVTASPGLSRYKNCKNPKISDTRKIAVNVLKFEQDGITIGKCVQKMQMEQSDLGLGSSLIWGLHCLPTPVCPKT